MKYYAAAALRFQPIPSLSARFSTKAQGKAMHEKPVILVVDDEHNNRSLMEDFLTPMGYEVVLARDGEEALEKVDEAHPDVVLLDVMMPKVDGFTVARTLKSREDTKTIPVVMLTALMDMGSRIRAFELGADDFFTKPVALIELKARMQSLLKIKAYNDSMIEDHIYLEAEVAKRTEQLEQVNEKIRATALETILRLSRAAEYRDEETGAHIQRMSRYAVAVARRMGIDEPFIDNMIYGLPMHDIGKIGVPDYILLKMGKLSPAEWEIMKQHTIIGGKILEGSDSELIQTARIIALTHHEKWNGKGYPEGLKGTDIPLVGRIASIADVFDALTSSRPYRLKPFSLEDTFRIIVEGRGTDFDPGIVDAFISIKSEIAAINEKLSDHNECMMLQMNHKAFCIEDRHKT
jgi:putative two-component system response regulator